MDSPILTWGLGFVRSVQSVASPTLTAAMFAVTYVGEEFFFLAAAGFVYWCVDSKKGAVLGIVLLLSAFLNEWLKELLAMPRPYDLDPKVGISDTPGFGFPSGHAQVTATFWGIAAAWIKKPWNILLAVLIPLAVGFSRIYLGVHFPTDVFGGWAIGGLIVAVYYALGDRLARFVSGLDIRLKLAIAAAISLIMNFLTPSDVSMSGAFFGFAAGYAISENSLSFSARGTWPRKALRLLAGLGGIALLYFGLKAVFPKEGQPQYALFRFLRYGFIGFWGSYGAPWTFLKLKLAKPTPISAQIE
jgi:membrane-associated phospholipid phosphatase